MTRRRPGHEQIDGGARELLAPSARARREADLFLADLLGHRRQRARPLARRPEWRGLPETEDEPQRPPQQQQPPAFCAGDVAVTDQTALLVTKSAPLPATCFESLRVVKDKDARDDYKSVAAVVPSPTEQRLLLFFHGDHSYVTMAAAGDVDPSVDPSRHSRLPRWLDRERRPKAAQYAATTIEFKLDRLAAQQKAFPWPAARPTPQPKEPVVLVPETGELNTDTKSDAWNTPPRCQYGVEGDGTPTGPGTTRLRELVTECYAHLRCLPNPSGRTYLAPSTAKPGTWLDNNLGRVYLCAHSGGGKPAMEALGADMALASGAPASPLRAGGALDVWLLDATYGGWGIDNYLNFCASWNNAGRLNYAPGGSRFVCVYNPASSNEAVADALRNKIAKDVLKVRPETLLRVHDSSKMDARSLRVSVIPGLQGLPVIFIKTEVTHMLIPTLFVPLLLMTAAS